MNKNYYLMRDLRSVSMTASYDWNRKAKVKKLCEDAADRIEKLEKALEIYQAERDRFKHAKPEITGAYYLAGGHGEKDQNMLPEYVEIVPAYGCAWSQIYQKTDRTISMEGS